MNKVQVSGTRANIVLSAYSRSIRCAYLGIKSSLRLIPAKAWVEAEGSAPGTANSLVSQARLLGGGFGIRT